MPIPAVPVVPESGAWGQTLTPPIPVDWQHTYVSLRGNDGQGEEISLTGYQSGAWPTIVIQPGASGLDMPPFDLHSDDSPNLDGSIYRGVRAVQREILLPVFVYGIDRKTFLQFKRKLASALNPKNGHCVLTFMESDGVARRIQCYYKGGMEGNESSDFSGFRWISYGIQLAAMDPWFYGDAQVAASWSFGTSLPFLGTESFLPLTLSPGTQATDILTVENPGDIEAWPIWKLTGPLRSFTFTGPEGTSWGIPANEDETDVLAEGRTLTVDCRPGFKTVKDDLGINYFPALSANPSLWSLPAGTSTVQTELVAGSGLASVAMSLNPRYTSY